MENYLPQIIATVFVTVLLPLSKYIIGKIVVRSGGGDRNSIPRKKQVRQIFSILLNVIYVISLIVIWGVQPQNLLIGLSSVFAVIGVAMFAQWSILSNITAGMIIFFSAPFRVGDKIYIIDKDNPMEAYIEGIHTFYTHIRTVDGEYVVIPNNIFLQKTISLKENKEDYLTKE